MEGPGRGARPPSAVLTERCRRVARSSLREARVGRRGAAGRTPPDGNPIASESRPSCRVVHGGRRRRRRRHPPATGGSHRPIIGRRRNPLWRLSARTSRTGRGGRRWLGGPTFDQCAPGNVCCPLPPWDAAFPGASSLSCPGLLRRAPVGEPPPSRRGRLALPGTGAPPRCAPSRRSTRTEPCTHGRFRDARGGARMTGFAER